VRETSEPPPQPKYFAGYVVPMCTRNCPRYGRPDCNRSNGLCEPAIRGQLEEWRELLAERERINDDDS